MNNMFITLKAFSIMALMCFAGFVTAKTPLCDIQKGVDSKQAQANHQSQINGVQIKRAWQPAMPHSVPVNAGYLSIVNNGNKKITLSSIHSEQFASVEFHRTRHENGIASMERVTALTVEAGETLNLEPQGLHLMMFRPRTALKDGDQYSVVLNTDQGENHCFVMTVGRCDQCNIVESEHDHFDHHHKHQHHQHNAHASSKE